MQIRPLAASDSLDELTSMLHRAFSPLGRLGLNCTGVNQSIETTAQRVRLGECLVAVCDGRLIGTLTLHKPERRSECRWYREADVASVHQFAVDPRYQGTGCGKALLLAAARLARERGFDELALDTPADASHLIAFYLSQGFRVVDQARLFGRSYRSSVLSKTISVASSARPPVPAAHYAPLFGAMVQA